MKFLIITFSFFSVIVYGQLQDVEICKDVFQKNPIDSTFKHYYIQNGDTIFFNNEHCLIHPQPSHPIGDIVWVLKDNAAASGELELHFRWIDKTEVIKGKFAFGSLDEGTWIKYYENGKLMDVTNYQNGIPSGEHFEYCENGNLTHHCIKDENGLCSPQVQIERIDE